MSRRPSCTRRWRSRRPRTSPPSTAATSRRRCAEAWPGCPLRPAGALNRGCTARAGNDGLATALRTTNASRSVARQNNVLQQRIDLVLPALAGKHAVIADARLHVVALEIGTQIAAEVMRGDALADGANVVALALDGEQHGAPDRSRIDAPAAIVEPTARKRMLLENEPDGLEIELCGEVEYGKVFVIEGLGDRRLLGLAIGQIFVQFAMRLHVPVDVHAHEGGELHEARIDPAKGARM